MDVLSKNQMTAEYESDKHVISPRDSVQLESRETMAKTEKTRNKDGNDPLDREARAEGENTLLPMLIAGLVLTVVGAIVVMTFV